MDDSGTTPEDGRWLTYAELAELRGITRKAAIRLTQRHQWRRQPGNDGATRVFVPSDITRRQTPRDDGTSDDFQAKALAILEVALMEANKRADAAQVLAERTLAELADVGARADRAEAWTEELRRDLDAARVIAGAAQHDAQAAFAEARDAQRAAEELRQAEEARKARGRLRRAWDGWRGR